MRLKRKLQYDISVDPLWWRHFNALVQQGLKPHLTRWYWKRGVRYAKDYEVQ